MTRRSFFQKTGVTAVAFGILQSQIAAIKAAAPNGLPVGSQTYPHRVRIQCGDFAGLLKDMKAIGIEAIELCNPSYAEFASLADGKATRKIADDNGLKVLSAHFQLNSLRTDLARQVAWAQELGMIQMGTATLTGRFVNGATTEEEVKRAAYEYNKIAEGAKNAGMQQILHNEGFENSRLIDGRLTYPVLLQYLDPELVKMQFQMSGMTTVGNPIMYFQNYPGRFASAHLQGVNTTSGMRVAGPFALPTKADPNAPAAAGGRGGRGGAGGGGGRGADPCAPAAPAAAAPPAARGGAPAAGGQGPLALGEDTVNWPAVFAAGKGSLKTVFVEQAWDATVKSVAYLKTLS